MSFTQSETKLVRSLLLFQQTVSKICLATSIMNSFAATQSSRKRHVSFFPLTLTHLSYLLQPSDASLTSPSSAYDDFPSPDFPTAPRERDREPSANPRFPRASEDREAPNGGARPRRSQDDYNLPAVGRRGDDPYGEASPNEPLSDRDLYAPSSRRKPSQDTTATARSQQQDLTRRPSVASGSDSTSATNAQSATATSGIIIPNKSTIAEEDIEVPYGRSESAPEDGDGEPDEVEGGLGALARRLVQDPDTDGGGRSDDYYDKMSFGRTSVASDRSARVGGGRVSAALNEDHERMRREYEFRIATMQTRIAGLEREIEDGDVRARQHEQSDQRVKQLGDELDKLRRVCSVLTFPRP
jgi:protein SPA2